MPKSHTIKTNPPVNAPLQGADSLSVSQTNNARGGNKKKWALRLLFLSFLIVASIFIIKRHADAPYQKCEGRIFGTIYHATYQHSHDLQADIVQQLLGVDSTLSAFNPNSTLSAVNQNRPITTTPAFDYIFTLAQKIARSTDGAFDPTVAPLVNLWGFGFHNSKNATPQAIDSILQFVGYQKVKLSAKHIVKQDPRLMLDFSGIAKGYACDVVASFLENQGIQNYMIEIGGEVRTHGHNPEGHSWNIGISKPRDGSLPDAGEIAAMLQLDNASLATSGNYRNFYYRDGRKYAHTIDPHTGRPVQHSLLSATVVAPTCAEADAYATAFMVLGINKAKSVLCRNPQLRAFFIYARPDGSLSTWNSPKLDSLITLPQ